MSNIRSTYLFSLALAIAVLLGCFGCDNNKNLPTDGNNNDSVDSLPEENIFGFPLNDYIIERDTIKRGDNLSKILARHDFDAVEIAKTAEKVRDSFDYKKLRPGKVLTLLKSKTTPSTLDILVYEPDNMGFNVINFKDSTYAYTVNYPVTYTEKTVAGEISGSLSESLQREGLDPGLGTHLSNAFAWSVDFFKFRRGDRFAVTVREKYINDTIYVGIDEILGAYFNYQGKEVYGFSHSKPDSKTTEFFDENGKQMKTMFLKAPLKYFRITSKFTKSRFHPVQKRWKAHNGTDYAAPHGTPIMATAAGKVIEAGYTAGNGNYVKIRHNATYTTQYLHMSKILVKRGQTVQQGQTIGRVGSTGLATGPHVCYRFWKNGVQVDPLKQNLPTSQAMDKNDLPAYLEKIKPIKQHIDEALMDKFPN
ncbi:M23 family metallopeptidase [Avrilella dinanensis]|uniref:Peptidase M23 n=1 Tax=Avrilella dinanensis TaxID=2008672 RepID=A0A2M9R4H4_9FLAO|nr:peptidoglycan DD-metalloendopeptidase family protein [Avrilella dinanensis]PJR03771.1 peptidase M23 [Avrilella dinanensis]